MDPDRPALPISELPRLITELSARARRPLLPGAQGPVGLFARYLRRKPGRGLAVVYTADQVGRAARGRSAGSVTRRSVSLVLDEVALDGARIRFSAAQARSCPVEVEPSGAVWAPELGLRLNAFPVDGGLPALAESCDGSSGALLRPALEGAARSLLGEAGWRIGSVFAEPIRYKPANRCDIRYRLRPAGESASAAGHLTLFGKVYADPAQARAVQAGQQRLYDEQSASEADPPFVPRPLGIVDELGLTLCEAVGAAGGSSPATGLQALRPAAERGPDGAPGRLTVPTDELRLAGRALARLHRSRVSPGPAAPRTGAKEAGRARDRAALIAGRYPGQAKRVLGLAERLGARLEASRPAARRPAHGGFKPSQLLFAGGRVFVVDFDGFCLADPALDVGYFLAYLRPSRLWYGRAGAREWFEAAAEVFVAAYRRAVHEPGLDSPAAESILAAARLYEAALIFKIASRRVNRLQAPRPGELGRMLDEIAACLGEPAAGGA